jgi:hypothetical protein
MLKLIHVLMGPIPFVGVEHNICIVFVGGTSSKSVSGVDGQRIVKPNQHCSSIFYHGMIQWHSLGNKCSIQGPHSRTGAICVAAIAIATDVLVISVLCDVVNAMG